MRVERPGRSMCSRVRRRTGRSAAARAASAIAPLDDPAGAAARHHPRRDRLLGRRRASVGGTIRTAPAVELDIRCESGSARGRFNRGQAVVARHLRSMLDNLGHETFVLARPTRGGNIRPSFIDRTGVWDQPGVTEASAYEILMREYEAWADATSPRSCSSTRTTSSRRSRGLRRSGVRTVGRFVWRRSYDNVAPAQEAFDLIYSPTASEQRRYAELGIESPRVLGVPPSSCSASSRTATPVHGLLHISRRLHEQA